MNNRLTVCNKNMCNGCSACLSICPNNAILIEDSVEYYNAIIDEDKCDKCGLCKNVCPNVNIPEMKKIEFSYQGWSQDSNIRKKSSSGGIATELSKSFIESGGIVCSCIYKKGEFVFELIDDIKNISKISGSKYIKSNPKTIYKEILLNLRIGKKILFIGLPCQVAAIKNYIPLKLQNSLYTVDLICHGTPSPSILELFLNQKKILKENINNITFRQKNKFSVSVNGEAVAMKGASDAYSLAFLNGLIYTENCYSCQFAKGTRVGDITLGDSWGSDLEVNEKKKGISLILCQNKKGVNLIKNANIFITNVDLDKAIFHNQQLKKPFPMPKEREYIFKTKEKRLDKLIFRYKPYLYIKQKIKSIVSSII